MNRGIYATSIGMIGLQRGLDVTANNLANGSSEQPKRGADTGPHRFPELSSPDYQPLIEKLDHFWQPGQGDIS